MPVSSATSRAAVSASVSPPSMWPLGRHHSTRPARLRRAMTAIRATPSWTSTTMPPARALLDRGEPAGVPPGGAAAARGSLCVTVTQRGAGARLAVATRDPAARRVGAVPARAVTYPWSLVSTRQPPAALLRQAVARLAPVLPLLTELGERFAAAGHELALVGGPVRDAFLGRISPDLDFTTDATPDADRRRILGLGRRALGHRARRSARSALRQGEHHRRGDDLPRRRLRRTDPQAGGGVRRQPRGRPGAARLHRQRDGAAAARRWSSSTRTAAWPTSRRGVLRTPAPPEESLRRRPAADDARRPVRRPARLRGGARGARRRCASAAEPLEIVSAERVRDELTKLLLSHAAPRRGLRLLVDTGLADHVLPELPALQLEVDEHHRHKDVYEHSLTVLEQAIALEGPRRRPAGVGARPRPRAAPRRAAARHRQAGDPAVRGRRRRLASTTTRWSAPSWPPSG